NPCVRRQRPDERAVRLIWSRKRYGIETQNNPVIIKMYANAVTSSRLGSVRKKAASSRGSAPSKKKIPRARTARNSSANLKTRKKPIGSAISKGRRNVRNSPISIVDKSHKLQIRSTDSNPKPATRDLGSR